LIKGSILGHQITKTIQSIFYKSIISSDEVEKEELVALKRYYSYSKAWLSSQDLLPSSDLLSSTLFSRWSTESYCTFGDTEQVHKFFNEFDDDDGTQFAKYTRERGVELW
jgi:hypothetical protein